MHANLVRKATERRVDAWTQFKVASAVEMGSQSQDVADRRWARTWKEAEGTRPIRARLVAKDYEGPDLCKDNVNIAGYVNRRSPHVQLISPGGIEEVGDLDSAY